MRHYYAATNDYADESSVGFANTWTVLAFANKRDRDRWVAAQTDLASRAIRKNDVKKYLDAPPPFSGLARVIDHGAAWCAAYRPAIGLVTVDQPGLGYTRLERA